MLRMKPKIYSLSGSQADDEREMIANTKEFKGESYGSAPDNTSWHKVNIGHVTSLSRLCLCN